MSDSFYCMPLKITKNLIFGVTSSQFCDLMRSVIIDVITYVLDL